MLPIHRVCYSGNPPVRVHHQPDNGYQQHVKTPELKHRGGLICCGTILYVGACGACCET